MVPTESTVRRTVLEKNEKAKIYSGMYPLSLGSNRKMELIRNEYLYNTLTYGAKRTTEIKDHRK